MYSDCCDANIILHDICSDCHEHCDVYDDEDEESYVDSLLTTGFN